MASTLTRRAFRISRAGIEMISKDPELLALAGERLAQYETPARGDAAIRYTLIGQAPGNGRPFGLPAEAELLHEDGTTRYFDYRGLWIASMTFATVFLNRATNNLVAFARAEDLRKPSRQEEILYPLFELLRRHGVYAHHAASVSLEGKGALLLGPSGQGKTTLSVDLLHRGFDFLGDDRCFLREGADGFEVLGYYEPVRYFPANFGHLEELASAGESSTLPELGNGKRQLDLRAIGSYRGGIVDSSALTALVFPRYSPREPSSRIEPLSPGEALIALLPLTMVCFDRATSEAHFRFCAKLTAALPAARLIMGRDRERWHLLMRDFLSSAPGRG